MADSSSGFQAVVTLTFTLDRSCSIPSYWAKTELPRVVNLAEDSSECSFMVSSKLHTEYDTHHTVVHQSLTSIYIPNVIEIGKSSLGRTNRRDTSKFKVT